MVFMDLDMAYDRESLGRSSRDVWSLDVYMWLTFWAIKNK